MKYLRIVGALNLWFIPVFLLFAGWITYLRLSGQRAGLAFLFLYLVPLAAGTGLLTSARKGNLDLLFGCGETRSDLWQFALRYAFAVPLLLSVLIIAISEPLQVSTLFRLIAALTFTLGVSFTLGLVETRYFAGILFLIVRTVYFAAGGAATLRQLDRATDPPSSAALCIAAFASPESILSERTPLPYVLIVTCLGVAALVTSYCVWTRVDFGGKRS